MPPPASTGHRRWCGYDRPCIGPSGPPRQRENHSMNLRRFVIAVGLLAVAGSASAVDLKSLKKSLGGSESSAQSSEGVSSLGGLGGLALPGISGKTAGNAAGVLEYCVKRKYLSGNAVASVKDKLLSRYGL